MATAKVRAAIDSLGLDIPSNIRGELAFKARIKQAAFSARIKQVSYGPEIHLLVHFNLNQIFPRMIPSNAKGLAPRARNLLYARAPSHS